MKLHEVNSPVTGKILSGGKRRFVGYLTAGYPDRESFFRIISRCEEEGLHIFEIGFPSKDPYADGEVIRHAHSVVDPAVRTDMDFWRRLRDTISAPIWLMGYAEDLVDSGMYRRLAEERLIDALVIPNVDNARRKELADELAPFGTDVLGFISQAAGAEENRFCLKHFPIIYHQLYSGPTGVANDSEDYLELLQQARTLSDSHLFAGFGIGTPERAQELLLHGFDGVIIGTAIMKRLDRSEEEMYAFVRTLADAVNGVKPLPVE